MKRLFMINLWILLGAWTLLLNRYEGIAISLLGLGMVFNLISISEKNIAMMFIIFCMNFIFLHLGDYSMSFMVALSIYLSTLNEVISQMKKPSHKLFKMVWFLSLSFYLCAFGFGMILSDYLLYWILTVSHIFLAPSLFCLLRMLQKSAHLHTTSCPSI